VFANEHSLSLSPSLGKTFLKKEINTQQNRNLPLEALKKVDRKHFYSAEADIDISCVQVRVDRHDHIYIYIYICMFEVFADRFAEFGRDPDYWMRCEGRVVHSAQGKCAEAGSPGWLVVARGPEGGVRSHRI